MKDRQEFASRLLALQREGIPDRVKFNRHLPRDVRQTIEQCLSLNPADRPTAEQLAERFACTHKPRSHRLLRLWIPLGILAISVPLLVFASRKPQHKETPTETNRAEPTHPVGLYDDGIALLKQERYALASVEFIKIGDKTNDGRAYACAAYCSSILKEPRLAIALSDKAIELKFATPAVYVNRAYNHMKLNNCKQAILDCNEALHLDPNLRAARLTRAQVGLMLHLQGTPLTPQTVDDINEVTRGSPNTAIVWLVAAQIYALSSNQPAMRDKAAQAVRQAVLAGYSVPQIQRTITLETLKNHPVYQEALTLTPVKDSPVGEVFLISPIP